MSQEGLDVPQVGAAFGEEKGRGHMAQGMGGNNRHPCALARKLDPGVKGLVAKGCSIPAREDEGRAREIDSPTPQPHALHTLQEGKPFLERARQFWCEWQVAEGASFDLEAGGDQRAIYGFADQPVKGKSRPLVIPAAGKEEGRRQVVG